MEGSIGLDPVFWVFGSEFMGLGSNPGEHIRSKCGFPRYRKIGWTRLTHVECTHLPRVRLPGDAREHDSRPSTAAARSSLRPTDSRATVVGAQRRSPCSGGDPPCPWGRAAEEMHNRAMTMGGAAEEMCHGRGGCNGGDAPEAAPA